jgi:hypothetical protein
LEAVVDSAAVEPEGVFEMTNSSLDERLGVLAAALEKATDRGCSVVLYGSAARGDWVEGRSDVNLLLVVDDPGAESLSRLTPAVVAWHDQGHIPPLLIGRDEWHRATDSFPIEITDMRGAYRVLAGADPIADLEVDPDDLRQALETEFRGKLIRLRQAFVRFGGMEPVLGGFAAATSSELLVLLRSVAVLLGRPPGTSPEATLASIGDVLGPYGAILGEIVARRRDPEWSCKSASFAAYIEAIARLADIVDTHKHGDSR